MRSKNYRAFFPKINHSKYLKNETFLTTDDCYFAKVQIDEIDNTIQFKEGNKLKPWQRIYKNIYSGSGKSNHQIISLIKNRRHQIQERPHQLFKHIKHYTFTEFNTIKAADSISNQILRTADIQKKYKVRNVRLNSFVSDNRKTFLTKNIINHLKNEHSKIMNKEQIYKTALKNANKDLNNDIDEFDHFIVSQNLHGKDDEIDLIKEMQNNKHLGEEIKLLNSEYSFLLHEIKRHLKLLVNTKRYVKFVCYLLGAKSELLKCTTLDNIDFNKINENDINIILDQINSVFESKLSKNEEIDKDIQNKLYDDQLESIFYIEERNIINTIHKNNDQHEEIDKLLREENYSLNEANLKLNNLQQEYLIYLKELEHEKENIKFISNNPENEDYLQYISKLLTELYDFIDPINSKKIGDDLILEVIENLTKEVYSKEKKINYFFKIMEKYDKEDPKLFKKTVNDVKNRSRRLKCLNEKKFLNIKLILKNKKVIDKLNKIIIKRKDGINIPPPINMNKYIDKKKDQNKTDQNISEFIEY